MINQDYLLMTMKQNDMINEVNKDRLVKKVKKQHKKSVLLFTKVFFIISKKNYQ
ncbi:MAG: hypothetical protein MJB14_02650 [Spirochaetes bacterium]|nr:hypothetical protein [Spirochaetota bacterium]